MDRNAYTPKLSCVESMNSRFVTTFLFESDPWNVIGYVLKIPAVSIVEYLNHHIDVTLKMNAKSVFDVLLDK